METPKNLLGNSGQNNQPQANRPQNSFEQMKHQFKQPPINSNNKKGQESGTSKQYLFVGILIGLIVGGLVGWFIGQNNNAAKIANMANVADTTNNEADNISSSTDMVGTDTTAVNTSGQSDLQGTSVTRPSPVVVSGSNDIAANDQKAGSTAEVTMITLSVPGWVAIHEDKNGALGNVLGASRFEPGIHLGEIELLRPTVSGGTYHAVLYQDNGDHMFDMTTDAAIKNADGQIIEATFKAQ